MSRPSLASLRRAIRAAADPARGTFLLRFMKAGKGEYAEGDKFLGIDVPVSRRIAKAHAGLPLRDVALLLKSPWHEERFIALLLLVQRFADGDGGEKRAVYDFYLRHAERANNWDLVDTSAYFIVGAWLADRQAAGARKTLMALARSENLWRRRIAIVSTLAFIRRGRLDETFSVCGALLKDKHDLIHKACGWMLREAGKRDETALRRWLAPRYRKLPRTMLRYAIERFPESERKRYLLGRI